MKLPENFPKSYFKVRFHLVKNVHAAYVLVITARLI